MRTTGGFGRLAIALQIAIFGLAVAGCGGDSGQAGGHCMGPDVCWEVTDPPNYVIDWMCPLGGNTWQSGSCDPSAYARRCTQDTEVTVGSGPPMTVRYVYYFPDGSTTACAGTEEILP